MSAYNSISQLLEQFLELNTNSLETFNRINEAITTDKETVTVDLYNPNDSKMKSVQIPAFGYLKREIERLNNNLLLKEKLKLKIMLRKRKKLLKKKKSLIPVSMISSERNYLLNCHLETKPGDTRPHHCRHHILRERSLPNSIFPEDCTVSERERKHEAH